MNLVRSFIPRRSNDVSGNVSVPRSSPAEKRRSSAGSLSDVLPVFIDRRPRRWHAGRRAQGPVGMLAASTEPVLRRPPEQGCVSSSMKQNESPVRLFHFFQEPPSIYSIELPRGSWCLRQGAHIESTILFPFDRFRGHPLIIHCNAIPRPPLFADSRFPIRTGLFLVRRERTCITYGSFVPADDRVSIFPSGPGH